MLHFSKPCSLFPVTNINKLKIWIFGSEMVMFGYGFVLFMVYVDRGLIGG